MASDEKDTLRLIVLRKIEAEAEKIAASHSTATQRIRNLIRAVEKTHHKQHMFDRKLHNLVEAATFENWAIMRRHNERMAAILEQIIASGMASGEFPLGDATFAARLVNTACIRFSHPRLIVEFEQELEPTLDQMIDLCLAVLTCPGELGERFKLAQARLQITQTQQMVSNRRALIAEAMERLARDIGCEPTMADICRKLRISPAGVYRLLASRRDPPEEPEAIIQPRGGSPGRRPFSLVKIRIRRPTEL